MPLLALVGYAWCGISHVILQVTEITLSYTFFKARDVDGSTLAMHDLDAQRALEYAEATKTATSEK